MSGLGPGEEELQRWRALCALHQRVGPIEMANHEFLVPSRRRQRSTFADGTIVTVDVEAGRLAIEPALGLPLIMIMPRGSSDRKPSNLR